MTQLKIHFARWHKWLALLIGIQLFIWLATGLYLNVTSGSPDAADNLIKQVQHEGYLPGFTLLPIKDIDAPPANKIEIEWILGKPYYSFYYHSHLHHYFEQDRQLYDAQTGQPYQVNAQVVATLAEQTYDGDNPKSIPQLIQPPIDDDPKQQNPLWQVNIVDDFNTSLYFDALAGHLITYTHDARRIEALMFKLHFMDYLGTSGFNHPWTIISAFIMVLLSITGAYLLIKPAVKGTQKPSLHKQHRFQLNGQSREPATQLTSNGKQTVLDTLASHDIFLPTECGGGGTCGQCRFQTSPDVAVTDIERFHLSETELSAGIRLGCQHQIGTVQTLSILPEKPSK